MRKLAYLLVALLFTTLNINAQEDFNEPPTRSEFEQLKSKIQVYEKKQNSVLGRMNSFDAEFRDKMLELDTIITQKISAIDSMASSELGVQADVVTEEMLADYAKKESLSEIKEELKEEEEEEEAEIEFEMADFILGGLILLLIILIIVQWLTRSSRMKKLKKEINEKHDEDVENLKSAIKKEHEDDIKNLKNEITTLEARMNAAIKDKAKETDINLMAKVKEKTDDLKNNYNELQDKFEQKVTELQKNISDSEGNTLKKAEDKISDLKTNSNEALKKAKDELNKNIEAFRDNIKKIEDKLKNK